MTIKRKLKSIEERIAGASAATVFLHTFWQEEADGSRTFCRGFTRIGGGHQSHLVESDPDETEPAFRERIGRLSDGADMLVFRVIYEHQPSEIAAA